MRLDHLLSRERSLAEVRRTDPRSDAEAKAEAEERESAKAGKDRNKYLLKPYRFEGAGFHVGV